MSIRTLMAAAFMCASFTSLPAKALVGGHAVNVQPAAAAGSSNTAADCPFRHKGPSWAENANARTTLVSGQAADAAAIAR